MIRSAGLGRILTQYVAQPMMDHPLTTAATGLIPGAGLVMSGFMAKDILEYAGQKGRELQMSPEIARARRRIPTAFQANAPRSKPSCSAPHRWCTPGSRRASVTWASPGEVVPGNAVDSDDLGFIA